MADSKLSLHRKLAQIMWDAERIPKRGKAPAVMGGYPFVQVGDAADFVRKALAEHVLSMLPTSVRIVGQVDRETKNGGNMTTVDIITTWTITDGESGESISFESFGAGADGGDKYSGKASTSAMKYALLTAFLLSTGDDTEAHAVPDQRPAGPARLETRVEDTVGVAGDASGEEELLVGRASRRGIVRKGTAEAYKLEPRQTPDGYAIGFRLEIDGDKNIPQVLIEGPLGAALLVAYPDPAKLVGKPVTVAGILYNVRGRQGSWYRLHVDRFEDAEIVLPAETDTAKAEEPQAGGLTPPDVPQTPTSGALFPEEGAPIGLCHDKSESGLVCGMAKNHAGRHRELATDGRVLASW